MKIHRLILVGLVLGLVPGLQAAEVKLELEYPKPMFPGTPKPIEGVPNLEASKPGERPFIMVPEGTTLLSDGKSVTSSDDWPVIGMLDYVTDGDKEGGDGYFVELGPDLQWVQVDLEAEAELHAILLWHYHSQPRVYFDVIVQVSNDPEFQSGVTTIYNNDFDNSAGMGVGKDASYIETFEGRLIDPKGVNGRYVRFYSAGNTSDSMNHYIEAEIYGK